MKTLITEIVKVITIMLFYYWYAHSIVFLILNYKNLSLTFPFIWAIMGIVIMLKNFLEIFAKRGNKND